MLDFETEAILLRRIEYGDHDVIITFMTKDRGKITVMARNAKKSVRRFSGSLDLFSFNHIQCRFPKKKRRDDHPGADRIGKRVCQHSV